MSKYKRKVTDLSNEANDRVGMMSDISLVFEIRML